LRPDREVYGLEERAPQPGGALFGCGGLPARTRKRPAEAGHFAGNFLRGRKHRRRLYRRKGPL
jgi:hypothetical protein